MNSLNFFADIPPIRSLREITSPENYYDVPSDWLIAITDIQGSTRAIENGRYKDVNVISAASITALLNVAGEVDLPYVFGGDGAVVLIPAYLRPIARQVLLATRTMAQSAFNLDMRVGIIPVRDVLTYGNQVRVAKLHVSDNFQQAMFSGGGISCAERLLKVDQSRNPYILRGDDEPYIANFDGLECRWHSIPSPSEETVSLMVVATPNDPTTYDEVIQTIENIYGDYARRNPVTFKGLKLRLFPWEFRTEALVRYGSTSFKTLWRMAKNTFMARVAMHFNLQGWGVYKPTLLEAIDNEKFDDALRMTIAGTKSQRQQLRVTLEELRARGRIVFGLHASSHAIMTCLVFDYFGRQVHFIDGADGGYARAALELKAQMKEYEAANPTAFDANML